MGVDVHSFLLGCLVLLSVQALAVWTLDYRPEIVVAGSRRGNPAIKIRLTQKGLFYVNNAFGQIIENALRQYRFPNINANLPLGGSVTLYNIRMTNFLVGGYETYLTSPNTISWRASNMDISLAGLGTGHVLMITDAGRFRFHVRRATIDTTMTLTNDGGFPRLSVLRCRATAGSLDFTVSGMRLKGAQNMLNRNDGEIREQMEANFRKQCCRIVDKLAQVFNTQVRRQPLQLSLLPSGVQFGPRSVQSQAIRPVQNLAVDYSLVANPSFVNNVAEIFLNGEVSFLGRGGTPFYPGILYSSRQTSGVDKMVHISIADFVINSLLYHVYRQRGLDFRLDRQSVPQYANMLRFQCNRNAGEMCLGTILPPQVTQSYPNAAVSLVFYNDRAPGVVFSESGARCLADPILMLYASAQLVAKLRLQADITYSPVIMGNVLSGTFKVNSLSLQMIQSSIRELNQDYADSLSSLASMGMELIVNGQLKQGIPVPSSQILRIVSPRLMMKDRYLNLETDVMTDPRALAELISQISY